MVHRDPGSGCRARASERTTLVPRVGNYPDVRGRASLPIAALNVSACKLAHSVPWPGCPALVQGRSAGYDRRNRGSVVPHAASPYPPRSRAPRPRAPGPPLMPAMAVTSLLAPRPGRWPGDPRRATAVRQHPEVHDAALPPAARARAGAWGARGAGSGPAFLRSCGAVCEVRGRVCGSHRTREAAASARSPRGFGKGA